VSTYAGDYRFLHLFRHFVPKGFRLDFCMIPILSKDMCVARLIYDIAILRKNKLYFGRKLHPHKTYYRLCFLVSFFKLCIRVEQMHNTSFETTSFKGHSIEVSELKQLI
jgi:hypothetical protein